eukprot:453670_1
MGCCSSTETDTDNQKQTPYELKLAEQQAWQTKLNRWNCVLYFDKRYIPNVFSDEITFYNKITKHWKHMTFSMNLDELVEYYTNKYNEFMLNNLSVLSRQRQTIGPTTIANNKSFNYYVFEDNNFFANNIDINIIFFWRIHMLHPILYQNDCSKHFGFLLSPPFHHHVINGTVINISELPLTNSTETLFTAFDFNISVRKNLIFMQGIIDYDTDYYCDYWKYKRDFNDYMSYKGYFENRRDQIHLCPTLLIDFVWHTYMMFPTLYQSSYRNKDHNDLIPAKKYKIYQLFSESFWKFYNSIPSSYYVVLGNYAASKYKFYTYEYQYYLIGGFVRQYSSYVFPNEIMELGFDYIDKDELWVISECEQKQNEYDEQKRENKKKMEIARRKREQEDRERKSPLPGVKSSIGKSHNEKLLVK